MDFSAVLKKKVGTFTRTLGESVSWTPAGGKKKVIRGIFTSENEVALAGQTAIETKRPIVRIKTTDILGIARNDIVVIQNTTYKVMRFTNDLNTGETTVYLKDN